MAAEQSALLPSQRLRVAYLLTLAGGYLDAYTYFERGGVFANAQTGNIVKLGIALAHGERDSFLLFLLPIGAFALGLLSALAVQDLLEARGSRLKRRSVLALEIVGLVVVSLIPLQEQYNTLANCIVSYVAALQYETFSTFHGYAIVTTMSTGNLRKFIDALYAGVVLRDSAKLRQALVFLSIIGTFTLGAFFGALGTDLWDRAAVLPAIVCLALAIVVITVLRRRNLRAGEYSRV